MKKVLIVSGHSNIQHDSVVNSLILKQVKQALPQVEIDSLCELYPDFKIDVAAEVYSREGGLGYTLEDLLLPVSRSTAGFVGMTLEPFIYTTGVSYALRSDEAQAKQLEEKALLHAQRLVEAIEKA